MNHSEILSGLRQVQEASINARQALWDYTSEVDIPATAAIQQISESLPHLSAIIAAVEAWGKVDGPRYPFGPDGSTKRLGGPAIKEFTKPSKQPDCGKVDDAALNIALDLENSLFDIIRLHDPSTGKFSWVRHDAIKVIESAIAPYLHTPPVETTGKVDVARLIATMRECSREIEGYPALLLGDVIMIIEGHFGVRIPLIETMGKAGERLVHIAGQWHHGNGYLCKGSLRIARADFDTNPSKEYQCEVFDEICNALNSQQPSNHTPLNIDSLVEQIEAIKEQPYYYQGVEEFSPTKEPVNSKLDEAIALIRQWAEGR